MKRESQWQEVVPVEFKVFDNPRFLVSLKKCHHAYVIFWHRTMFSLLIRSPLCNVHVLILFSK